MQCNEINKIIHYQIFAKSINNFKKLNLNRYVYASEKIDSQTQSPIFAILDH